MYYKFVFHMFALTLISIIHGQDLPSLKFFVTTDQFNIRHLFLYLLESTIFKFRIGCLSLCLNVFCVHFFYFIIITLVVNIL